MRSIGLDLTDPYARQPRDVDVAVVDASWTCTFHKVPAQLVRARGAGWLGPIAPTVHDDLLVIDGPLALASAGRQTRECERQLGTPGHTGDALPTPGSRPFAGYIRGAVELAHELVAQGWRPATSGLDPSVNLLEAYPGSAWPALAGKKLPHKGTPAGRQERLALLQAQGLRFPVLPNNHDELDAALCALLGMLARQRPALVHLVGLPCSPSVPPQWMREGVIVQPSGASPTASLRAPSAQVPSESRAASSPGLVVDWVYFATPAGADRWETVELALRDGVIARSAHRSGGALIALVGRVQPGHTMLLAYGKDGRYDAVATFLIQAPPVPVPGAPALQRFEPGSAVARRLAARYARDPILGAFTGFLVSPIEVLQEGLRVDRRGQNSIQRCAISSTGPESKRRASRLKGPRPEAR